MRYDERKVLLSVDSIYEYLEHSLEDQPEVALSKELRGKLSRLKSLIDRLLRP
jgi:ParB family transcriptional regulator, chromosome partitioning protein